MSFFSMKIEKLAVNNGSSRNCDSREAGNWPRYLFEIRSQTHSEKSRFDFVVLRGKNRLESTKKKNNNNNKTLYATSQKKQKRPYGIIRCTQVQVLVRYLDTTATVDVVRRMSR